MRAFTYNIEAELEDDAELIRRANKAQICSEENAYLAIALIMLEMKKLKHGFKSCDWWFNYKSHSFDIVSSKSEPSMRQIGALTLSQWDNLKVKYEEDWTLADLLDFLEQHLSLSVDFMIQSGRMIFNKAMPTHVNKKKKA